MRTIKTIKLHVCTSEPMHKVINREAKERGYTDSMGIYASDSHDMKYTDAEGNKCMIGKRLTKDKKNRVEFIVINTFDKLKKHRELEIKHILND